MTDTCMRDLSDPRERERIITEATRQGRRKFAKFLILGAALICTGTYAYVLLIAHALSRGLLR